MLALPADTAVTIPEIDPMVAIAVLLQLHLPPDVASVRAVLLPVHGVSEPEMGASEPGITVTLYVAVVLPQLLVTV